MRNTSRRQFDHDKTDSLGRRLIRRAATSRQEVPQAIHRYIKTLIQKTMTASCNKYLKERTLNKIRFLEDQLVSLDHYLPETHDYLIHELDLQKLILAELEVQEHFNQIDEDNEHSTH
jgi:hypothetical protein